MSARDGLFSSDPRRLVDLLLTPDPDARRSGLKTLDDLLLCEIARYGATNDEGMIGPISALYAGVVAEWPAERRWALYECVLELVSDIEWVGANAFLPFIVFDPEPAIVARAVLDFVSLAPLVDDDPMTRPREVAGLIERGSTGSGGAAFGALLNLGDARVCQLLVPLRDALDADAIRAATHACTGILYAATVEFYLDWLESLLDRDPVGNFGLVASGLLLLRRKAQAETVLSGLRPFPASGVTEAEWRGMARTMPLAEYRSRIHGRFLAIEEREPPPRIMPHVLAEWGIEPSLSPQQTAKLGEEPGDGVYVSSANWSDGSGAAHLVWGILNPSGPTLYVIGTRREQGGTRTFYRMMHFLGGWTAFGPLSPEPIDVGRLHLDLVRIDEHLRAHGESGIFHAVPGLLIASGDAPAVASLALRLVADGDAANRDWGCAVALVEHYGSNFFARAGAEIRMFYDASVAGAAAAGREVDEATRLVGARYGHVPDFAKASPPAWEPASLDEALLRRWWEVVGSKDHQVAGLVAAREMWEGARSMVGGENVPFDDVLRFLANTGFDLAR